jgi:DNA-binding transcriptional MerR regulator
MLAMEDIMKIGDASHVSGLPAVTIRYYEEIGLISPGRRENGYRDYSDSEIGQLCFIQRARSSSITCACKAVGIASSGQLTLHPEQ